MPTATVSFVIPHAGRVDFLVATLGSILTLEIDDAPFEMIVVTKDADLDGDDLAHKLNTKSNRVVEFQDDSDDQVATDPVQTEEPSVSLRILKYPVETTIAALRNYGALASSGQCLAFLDADVELSRNWLRVMFDELTGRPDRVIVSAMQANSAKPNQLERVRVALSNLGVDNTVQFINGRNLFLKRETFDAVGGFPAHLVTCEDYLFTENAGKLGELYYTSGASFVHLGEDRNYRAMTRKEIWRGQSNLRSMRDRRISLREAPSLIVPLWVLAAIIAVILALLLSSGTVLVLALLAFALPIALYSGRLLMGAPDKLNIGAVFGFYALYMPARGLGMVMGLIKAAKERIRIKRGAEAA